MFWETTWVQSLLSSMWLFSASLVCRCWIFSIVQLVVGHRGGLVLRVCLGWILTCSSSFAVVSAFGGGGCAFCVVFRLLIIALFPICSHSKSVVSILTFSMGFRLLVAALLPICSHSESVFRCCVCAVLCVRAHC